MAGYRHELWAWAPYRRLVSSRWVLLAVVAATAGGLTPGRPNLKLGVGYSLMNLGLAVLVERCVRFPENRIGKLLNAAPLVWVGAISYSLYLWQEVFLDPDVTAWWAHWPASLGLTVAAAYLSYRFVERPILAWRDRKTSRKPPVPPGAPLILGQPVE
jgi:peptidoglycan/LPS O-acetylase OafA/YrhL